MCSVTSQENFSKAKIVLAEILSHNHEKKAVAVNISKCMRNSLVPTQARHGGHSVSGHSCPVRKNCTGMKTAGASSPRQELESSYFVESSPAEKYRKIDVNMLAAEVCLPQTECNGSILFDKSPDGARQTNPGCEREIVLNYMHQSDTNIDHKCVTQTTVSYSQVDQIDSKGDHNVSLGCARQLDSNVKRCYDSVKETVNNNAAGQISLLKHNTDDKDNDQQIHKYHSITENRDKESLSFRMSIKCSGKVSRWLNIKVCITIVLF